MISNWNVESAQLNNDSALYYGVEHRERNSRTNSFPETIIHLSKSDRSSRFETMIKSSHTECQTTHPRELAKVPRIAPEVLRSILENRPLNSLSTHRRARRVGISAQPWPAARILSRISYIPCTDDDAQRSENSEVNSTGRAKGQEEV